MAATPSLPPTPLPCQALPPHTTLSTHGTLHGGALCSLRVLRRSALRNRVTLSLPFVTELLQQPVDGVDPRGWPRTELAVDRCGSRPEQGLPVSCAVAGRILANDFVEWGLVGLAGWLRANGAAPDQDLLLLVAVRQEGAHQEQEAGVEAGGQVGRMALQLHLIRAEADDVPPGAFAALHSVLRSRGTWLGRSADLACHYPALAAVQRPGSNRTPSEQPLGLSTGAAAGGLAISSSDRAPAATILPPDLPHSVAQLLSRLPPGLDPVHVHAVAAFLACAGSRRLGRPLPARALASSLINAPQGMVELLHPVGAREAAEEGRRGMKPREARIRAVAIQQPQKLQHVYLRGSPRGFRGGKVEWSFQGFRMWLRACGAEVGDLLLLWAEEEGGVGGAGQVLRVHVICKSEVGDLAFDTVLMATRY